MYKYLLCYNLFMKLLLTFLLIISTSFAYKLQKSYTYDTPVIYASDLFPQIHKEFEVIQVPSHLQHFQISQTRLYELFSREGIELEGRALGVVHFRRSSDLDLSDLKDKLEAYYLKHLPFLTINHITIKSNRYINSLPKKYEIVFKTQLYKRNNGTFKIITDTERIFFTFNIEATYSQFQAKHSIKKGTLLTTENTKLAIVNFKRTYDPLIGFDSLSKVEAKRYLKRGKIITLKDVKKISLVKKGAIVNVKLIEGNILIHFTAKALKSGNMHESIDIKKNDGTKLRAKIIGKNKVTIE